MNDFNEIEKALLSAVAQWPDSVIPQVDLNSGRELFYAEQNRLFFDTIHHLWSEGKQFDLITCCNAMERTDVLKSVGGASAVTQIWFTCPTAEIAPYYIETLLDGLGRRKLVKLCADSTKLATQATEELSAIVANHQHQLSDISMIASGKEKTWPEQVQEVVEALLGKRPDESVVSTGIEFLDQYSRMSRGCMPLIGGQRKSGKTTLALSILLNVAKQGIPSAYLTLEETVADTVKKLLSGLTRIPIDKLQQNDDEFCKAGIALSVLPITVVGHLRRLSQISAWCFDQVKRNSLAFVIVDYAQIVTSDTAHKDANRQEKVAEISRELQRTAMECRIPLLLLSQLNADQETRESRALEQDCSAMWRLEVIEGEANVRKLRIPFQRHGPSDVWRKVTFLGDICRVENLAREER